MMLARLRFRLALLICPELGESLIKASALTAKGRTVWLWPNPWVPQWWYDTEVREFILWAHGKMTAAECLRQGEEKFGPRFPPKTSLYRAFKQLSLQALDLEEFAI